MKRHLGVRMRHQPHQTQACSNLLEEYLGSVMGVHRGCEQQLRLRRVHNVLLYCTVLIELRNRKLPRGNFFFQSVSES